LTYLISENTLTKQHLNMTPAQFEAQGYDWNAVFIINQQERDYYSTGEDIL
jgi:hypothetical protein